MCMVDLLLGEAWIGTGKTCCCKLGQIGKSNSSDFTQAADTR